MSAGGLTGAGGSIAGTAPPPLARQPDSAALISYAQASQAKAESRNPKGPAGQPKADSQPEMQLDERNQKLQDIDAMQGRPNFGEPGNFAGCAAGAAKDVIVDTAKGTYETARDGLGTVLGQAGVDGFEGHTERTVARGEAMVDGAKKTWDAATSPVETTMAVYQAGKEEITEIGAEIDNGDSCALGERIGTTVGVSATIAIPAGAAVKSAKVLTKMGGRDGVEGQETNKADSAISPNEAALIDEVAASGAKINSGDVIDIRKTSDGRVVWLEKGSKSAGHEHIFRHAEEFGQRGISENEIPNAIFTALAKGEIVGYQGKGTGRPIYEFDFNGETQRVAITVGDNGFIVGANPAK